MARTPAQQSDPAAARYTAHDSSGLWPVLGADGDDRSSGLRCRSASLPALRPQQATGIHPQASGQKSMKTKRLTILLTPEQRTQLQSAADAEGLSISELVRNRAQHSADLSDCLPLMQQLLQEIRVLNRRLAKAEKS